MKILIIAASHGNELLGIKLIHHIVDHHPEMFDYLDVLVGNPRANKAKSRYIANDLNRSYQKNYGSYEKLRAKYITRYIANTEPDLVIDMHTTSAKQPTFIVAREEYSESVARFLRSSRVPSVVFSQSNHDITSNGPHVIGYEVAENKITNAYLELMCIDLINFTRRKYIYSTKVAYRMDGVILKSKYDKSTRSHMKNFEESRYGFYPILLGERAYMSGTDYCGFYSNTKSTIQV